MSAGGQWEQQPPPGPGYPPPGQGYPPPGPGYPPPGPGYPPPGPGYPPQKSGLVTAVAIINFVLGGLGLLCGILAFAGGALLSGAGGAQSKFEAAIQEAARKQGQPLPDLGVGGTAR